MCALPTHEQVELFPAFDCLSVFPLNAVFLSNNLMASLFERRWHAGEVPRRTRYLCRLLCCVPPFACAFAFPLLGQGAQLYGNRRYCIAIHHHAAITSREPLRVRAAMGRQALCEGGGGGGLCIAVRPVESPLCDADWSERDGSTCVLRRVRPRLRVLRLCILCTFEVAGTCKLQPTEHICGSPPSRPRQRNPSPTLGDTRARAPSVAHSSHAAPWTAAMLRCTTSRLLRSSSTRSTPRTSLLARQTISRRLSTAAPTTAEVWGPRIGRLTAARHGRRAVRVAQLRRARRGHRQEGRDEPQ